MKVSMADYLVRLFLKYCFRALIAGVALCLVFESAMQVNDWGGSESLEFHVFDLSAEILWSLESGEGSEEFESVIFSAAAETVKVWGLTVLLVIGFGLPLGMVLGRLGCAGKRGSRGRRGLARLILAPCLLFLWVPAFGLASLMVLYLIDVVGLSVFELMKNGGQGFSGDEVQVARSLRLLLPAGVVAVCSVAWLAREVALILWRINAADFVRAAEDRGLFGERLFYHYVVKSSLAYIGGAILCLLPFLSGALILVEWVFHFPGLGSLIITEALGDEFGLLLLAGALLALMVLGGSFLIEGIFGAIDQSTRMHGGVRGIAIEAPTIRNENPGNRLSLASDHRRSLKRLKQAWITILLGFGIMWGLHLYTEFAWREVGRLEVFERILAGASGTLAMGLVSSILAVLVSFCLAALCGCLGGWRGYCLVAKIHSAILVVPTMFWLLLGLAVSGSGFWSVVLILSYVGGLLGTGVVSHWLLDMESRGWIEAARAMGLNRRQIFCRHFVPVVWLRMLSRGLILLPAMLLFAVAADFSGLSGSEEGGSRWGILMAEGKAVMLDDPDLLIFSVGAVCLSAAAFALLASWARFKKGDRPGPDIY